MLQASFFLFRLQVLLSSPLLGRHLHIHLVEFFSWCEGLPALGILRRIQLKLLHLGHDVADSREEWLEDEADKSGLALRNLGCLPVA